jgi:hypothetical protein
MKRNIPRLVSLFQSASEIGRIAGVHRTAVHRWQQNGWQINVAIQIKLLKEAQARGLDLGEVAMCLGIERCDCCGTPINREIRAILLEGACVPKAKAVA